MLVATANLDSTGTFAVVTLLSLVGLIMLSGTEWLKRKLLAWAVD
jgi:ABC-type nitrate/sulfonate/bicarbonate transport system permease component